MATAFHDDWNNLRDELGKVIVGHADVVEGVLTGLFAGGHVLLEGVPGLGKTLLVRSLAQSLSLDFSRIQFTPDLMPADVTGTTVVEEDADGRRFVFRPGPVFAQIVLADEISPDTCRLWDLKTEKKLVKDRFRKDLGIVIQGYQMCRRQVIHQF